MSNLTSMPSSPIATLAAALAATLTLGACALGDADVRYKKAVNEPPLRVPDTLSPRRSRTLYPISGPLPDTAPERRGATLPQRLLNPADGSVRLQTLGDRIWINAEIPSPQLWPRLRGFIAVNQIPTRRMDVRNGIVETGWLKIGGDERRQKFRFWVESGLRENTSEIHILQVNRTSGDTWPARSDDLEQARLMLDNLARYIVELVSSPSAISAQAQYVETSAKMRFEVDANDFPVTRINVSYERAWASALLALEKTDLLLLDRDRRLGTILLAYDPKGEDRKRKLLDKERKKEDKRRKKEQKKEQKKERKKQRDKDDKDAESPDSVRAQTRNLRAPDPERLRKLAEGLPRVELRLKPAPDGDGILMTLHSDAEDFNHERAGDLMRSITAFII